MSIDKNMLGNCGMNGSPRTAKGLFMMYDASRDQHLERQRQCAKLTLPYLLPPQSYSETQQLPTPFSGIGAKAVNNLASRLQLSLFSPNQPYFKLEVDEAILQEIEADGGSAQVEAVKKSMNEQEKIISSDMEREGFRTPLFLAIKYAVVLGNYLLHIPAKGQPTVFRLDMYVVRRDARGEVMEIILKEYVSKEDLDENTLAYAEGKSLQSTEVNTPTTNSTTSFMNTLDHIEVYTYVQRKGKFFHEHQELSDGYIIPGSEGKSPIEAPSFVAGRWTNIPGESYGRSICEEYLGDLRSLEALYRSTVKATAIMSKLVHIVNPAGLTNIGDLARAETGDFILGNGSDVTPLISDKRGDLSSSYQLINMFEQRISQAFLITAGMQRDAERVTAEEIRMMAEEMENSLGGVYSVLSEELQLPVLRRQLSRLRKANKIPNIPNKDVRPKIIAGIDGLGRGQELQKISTALGFLQQSPEMMKMVDQRGLINKVFNSLGLDSDGILKTDETLQADMQKQQQLQGQQMMGEAMSKGMANSAPVLAKGAMENPEQAQAMMQQMQEQAMQQQQPQGGEQVPPQQ